MTLGAFRNTAGSQGAGATPQAAITVPRTGGSAVQDTDYCVLTVMAGGGTGAAAAPDGTWTTLKADTTINAGGARYAIYGKIIGSATTITPSWPSAPTSGNNTAHFAIFFSGVSGAESVGLQTVPGAASTATICDEITTTGPDRIVLAIAFNKGGSGGFPSSVAWSGGFTPRGSQLATGNFYPSISIASLDKPTAGGTTDQTATWNFSTLNQVGIQLALIPSVAGLLATLSVSPTGGPVPTTVTATVSTTGGNGNPKTYSMVWGDGSSSGVQSSPIFTHDYTVIGEYDPVASVVQT